MANDNILGGRATCLFTRLERVLPGLSRVSDSPVSAENVIYETFVLMGEFGGSALYCLSGGINKLVAGVTGVTAHTTSVATRAEFM